MNRRRLALATVANNKTVQGSFARGKSRPTNQVLFLGPRSYVFH